MSAAKLSVLDALRRGDLAGARELRLPGLAEAPPEIFGLADTLEILDLGDGPLRALPPDMGRLKKLRALFCSNARFEWLPPQLSDCPSLSQIGFRGNGMREVPAESLPPRLRWLTLTDNRIERLPDALGERPALQKLMLAGNRLDSLPRGLARAEKLELIRLSANRFAALPGWLADLPALAWAAYAGNPCENPIEARAAGVRWAHVETRERLGEGASGHVYRAEWRRDGAGAPRAVALKLFKGAMTSDGLPAHEMAACLAAGDHPGLVGGLGRVVDHPEGRDALLTPLAPAGWRVLARPPSLESCSRDVYEPAPRLTPARLRRLARDVAGATAHLHARGVMHGDLYAHNILWDEETGAAMVSDFGAACALPEGAEGDRWRRVETRAFGLLLSELLTLCPTDPSLAPLQDFARACVAPETRRRPFVEEALALL
jgi:hypothetical protein